MIQNNIYSDSLAAAFAKALNCQNKYYFESCECVSCHKIDTANHPDIHKIGEDEDVRSIKIEEIRNLIASAALKPYEASWKVFILFGAERLTLDASNALLKTLEEAPAQTIFILTTTTRANMLETIQSRTFEVRLKPSGASLNAIPLGFGSDLQNRAWEDVIDEKGGSREDLRKTLEAFLLYFRERLADASRNDQEALLQAIESVMECKSALDENVNPKLVGTRMAMKLRQALPKRMSS